MSAAILFHMMDSRSSATSPPVMAVSAFHALRRGALRISMSVIARLQRGHPGLPNTSRHIYTGSTRETSCYASLLERHDVGLTCSIVLFAQDLAKAQGPHQCNLERLGAVRQRSERDLTTGLMFTDRTLLLWQWVAKAAHQ